MLFRRQQILVFSIIPVMLVLAGAMVMMGSVPPVSRDALSHHLLVPKRYLQMGQLGELPDIPFSYYPMNIQLLYMVPLYFGNDVAPAYIHLAFGLLTTALIIDYLRKRLSLLYGVVGGALFLSLPIVVRLSTVAYVDLGLVFFSTASIMCFIRWTETQFAVKHLMLSGIFCGLCMGAKYNGLIVLCLMALMIPFVYVRRNRLGGWASARALAPAALFFTVAVLVFSPWAVRNALWTGNPLYPLFHGVFNVSSAGEVSVVAGALPPLDHFSYRRLAFGEPWWMIALVPLRVFFQGVDDNPQFFDGALNPYLLLLPVLALLTRRFQTDRGRRANSIWLAFAALYIGIVFFQIDMRIRWILPAVPPLVILSVYGIRGAAQWIDTVAAGQRAHLMRALLVAGVAALMIVNARYVADLWGRVAPMDTLSGRMTRDEYIIAQRPETALFFYANRHLSADSELLGLFLGGRYYYSDLPVTDGAGVLLKAIRSSDSPAAMARFLSARGHDYLMMYTPLLDRWLADNLSPPQLASAAEFFSEWTQAMAENRGYALVKIVR